MYTTDNTELHTWFERDRAVIELRMKDTQKTVIELRDEDVDQAFEDGSLSHHAFAMGKLINSDLLHREMIELANECGIGRKLLRGE